MLLRPGPRTPGRMRGELPNVECQRAFEGGRIQVQVIGDAVLQPIGDVACDLNRDVRLEVRPLVGAEQARVVVVLRHADREPALDRADEREAPAADDVVEPSLFVHILPADAERQLDHRRDDQLVRRVEQAEPVQRIGIVLRRSRDDRVVVEHAWRRRVEVRLAELVVLEPAQRVGDRPAPPAGEALAQREHGGVIQRAGARRLRHADVAELRERAQQLPALDRCADCRTHRLQECRRTGFDTACVSCVPSAKYFGSS